MHRGASPYDVGWFHKEYTETLMAFMEAVENRESPRLIIQVPPRHGKSYLATERFPAFLLGHHPDWEVVGVTYNQHLANRFGRKVRYLLNSPQYSEIFPGVAVDRKTNSSNYIMTTAGGSYTATGIGGTLTGVGAHVAIIDDPHKDRKEADSALLRDEVWDWYSSTLRTRLYPGAGVIEIQTRWHEDDLAGRLLTHAAHNKQADQFHLIDYPAIALEDEEQRKKGEPLHPERYSLEELLAIKASMLPRDWNALYQQRPSPEDGDMFKRAHIQTYEYRERPPLEEMHNYVTCDLAISDRTQADYTCIWGGGLDSNGIIWFSHEFTNARIGADDICSTLLDRATACNAMAIIIEGGAIQRAIQPTLKRMMMERGRFFKIIAPVPIQDKILRARPLQARMEQGRVRFPNAPFMETDVIPQMLKFPNAKHDDIVDSASWFAYAIENSLTPTALTGAPAAAPHRARAPGEWTMADVRERSQVDEPDNPHSPPRLSGGARKKRKPYA